MKTLNRGFVKRALSVLLTLIMILSLCAVGIVSSNAADVDLADTGVSSVALPGSFNNWTDSTMSYNSSNSRYEQTISLEAGTYTFKIKTDGNWRGNSGTINDSTGSNGWYFDTNVGDNCTLKASGGTYTFSYDASANNLYVSYTAGNVEGTATVQLPGAFNNWSGESSPMTYNSSTGRYEYSTYLESGTYEFKVTVGGSWYSNSGTINDTADGWTFSTSEGNNCKLQASGGTYLFSFDNSSKKLYVTYTAGPDGQFWVDIDGDAATLTDIIYPENNTLYLPSGADSVTFGVDEGLTLTVDGTDVTGGSPVALTAGSHTLDGSFTGTLKVLKSSKVTAIYTTTEIEMPTTTGKYEHKDDYSTTGSIMITDADGTVKLPEGILDKVKGRGNSSWEASNRLIGKYAFNITLEDKVILLEGGEKSKKYCLVSYNADEARMRNMIIYDLANDIGVKYVAKFEPVDLYNNGKYIGSYLLTDKVEVGDDDEPLVDIYDIDGANEDINAANGVEIDDSDRGYGFATSMVSGSGINTIDTAGFYKYVNMDYEDTGYIDAQSGFLLEFELDERFASEISGFISTKGQQIVCKYPELASKSQVEYIMNIWNVAEAIMYDDTATYEELNAVIDVESFAKMYLIQELSKNLDGGATSYYIWYDGGKLHAGCAWDYDWTLGQYIQSGDETKSVANQTSGKFDSEANQTLDKSEGWWINSKEIYPNKGTLNAQAALCQNDNFWNVVKAEWNELFYDTALTFSDSTVSSVSDLDGKIAEFYNQVKDSTVMDEDQWTIIKNDPMSSWGSTDTGDTHDAAVVWLNNFYYNRLDWMNDRLASTTYTLAAPTLTADKETYAVGETVTLTAESNSSGMLTYNFYDAGGNLLDSVDSDTGSAVYSCEAAQQGKSVYSVTVTSDNTTAETDAAETEVLVEGFNFAIDVTAPESVQVGDDIVIDVTSNAEETVTYNLLDAQRNIIDTNNTGDFVISTTAEDEGKSYYYSVEASVIVDGETYTDAYDFIVAVNAFTFSVTLNAPASVEAGMVITLNATAPSNSTVNYKFYTSDGTPVEENNSGIFKVETTQDDLGAIKSYYVKATTTVAGTEYTAISETVNIEITEVKEVYDVTIYFKSTSTFGYKPLLTTTGAVENFADYAMIKDIFICKNATETASYYWYKADVQVSKASPALSVSILSSRYAMEGDIDLTITQSGAIYLAVDNLNEDSNMVDLTDWTEEKRNWTQSALHMIYDDAEDSKASLAEVSARVNLTSVGDANGDGAVNIKDATLIQKFLASLESLNAFGKEISDVNDDGYLTIKDATAIQKKIAGCL